MFFRKKGKKADVKCGQCNAEIDSKKYRFCPYCGTALMDEAAELKEFGMLGQEDMDDEELFGTMLAQGNLTFADKMLNSIVQQLLKTLGNQMQNPEKSEFAEVRSFPNGIKVKINAFQPRGQQNKKEQPQELTEKQLEKIATLPRTEAKTNVRRLSDKVVYELMAPGVESPEDVIVSKLEKGYEIKAIGKNKVYVNSFPINLPLRKYWLNEKGLTLEFGVQ